MRILLVFAVLFLFGCESSTLPPPSADLGGTWAERFDIPGAAFGFTIDQVGDSLHGAGTYAVEAGPSGTFEVRGSYTPPDVALVFTYDQNRGSLRQVFSGRVQSFGMVVRSLVGTVTDSAGHSFSATYTRH